MTGKIRKLVPEKGFGFIYANGLSYFFHKSAVQNTEWDDLCDMVDRGDVTVSFNEGSSDKGPRAESVRVG